LKKRILIIDDETEVRSILSRILTQAGFEVVVAASGDEATRVCRQQAIDMIVVDMVMPEKDGLETLMEIRRSLPQVRIIAMSGAPRRKVMDPLSVALKVGAVATLSKPFTPKEFLSSVLQNLPCEQPTVRVAS
jgi:two-component system chemotaxis response regulator CheY